MDEPQLQQRVAMLEQRMVWLEHALAHLQGQRGAAAPALPADLLVNLAAAAPSAPAAPLAHAPGRQPSAAAAPDRAAPGSPLPVQRPGQPAAALPRITPPPAIVAAAVPPAAAVAPPAPRAPAPAGFDLRLTGAFSTLEAQVQEAADLEAAARDRRPAAPMLELNPELAATGRLLRAGNKLEVRCALEVQYPSVMQNLLKGWTSPAALTYLQRLIQQDTGGRLGVDPAVKEEIQVLYAIRATF
jgi:hypothetical protein